MVVSKEAKKIIHTAAVAAGGVGVTPIPFADSVILLPIQTAMIVKLYRLNNKKVSAGTKKGIVTSLTVSTIGKGIAGNLFKFFPGVGTVTGGVMNATVAVALTEMIGFSIADALENDKVDDVTDLLSVVSEASRLIKR
ncbi:hypothetical protein CBF34_04285 [Vagococcus penaei]|uniref:Uncharacterized protein n=1 Tax=Vagococcus penaei TaxID=633807 RepID=A0A1Q2D2Z8_9ENTE|nr:DUF697 domain-containing protein [Vagococcus penaei]AQP52758.1 hypothetical protein BW732_00025 [Vagococcus penaei]RSU05405.1 hypothetical protein CBF34_04285 [Vagococcus penaei]